MEILFWCAVVFILTILLYTSVLLWIEASTRTVLWRFICDVWTWLGDAARALWNWLGRVSVRLWTFVCEVWNWIGRMATNLNLIFAVILAGLAVLLIPHWGQCTWRDIATPMLGALACLAAGGVVGFLFGIPRTTNPNATHATPPPAATGGTPTPPPATPNPPQPHSGHDVNNSLEQISDWLTKIVVGLGLVEMRNFPTYLESMAERFEQDLHWPVNRSFAVALMVFFAAMGFLYSYVLTRLKLSPEFRRVDREIWGETAADEAKRVADSADKKADLNSYIAIAYHMLKLPTDQYLDKAATDLINARQGFLDDRRSAMVLGTLYAKKHRYDDAIRVLKETLAAMASRGTRNDVDEGDIRYNIACYFCRRRLLPTATPGAKADDLEQMYRELSESIKLQPANAVEAATDSDFKSVRLEPRFIGLIIDEAIRILENKLVEMERLGVTEPKELAENQYKLACFYALRCLPATRTTTQRSFDLERMKDLLGKAIGADKDLIDKARSADYFDSVRQTPEFATHVKPPTRPPGS